jgi:hypothetical protein
VTMIAMKRTRGRGWGPGHRVDVEVVRGGLLVASAIDGAYALGSRGDLALPVAARTLCGMTVAEAVVVALYARQDLVMVYPVGAVALDWSTSSTCDWRHAMSPDPDRLAEARAILAHLGVTVADLQREERPPVPTLAEYLPQVLAAAGPGARRTYGSYWQRMAAVWGSRRLDTIAASDIEALQHATVPRPGFGGPAAVAVTPASTSSPPPARDTTALSPTA